MLQKGFERVLVGTVLVLTAKVLWPVAKTILRSAAHVGGQVLSSAAQGLGRLGHWLRKK